jgi:hypothetical protein
MPSAAQHVFERKITMYTTLQLVLLGATLTGAIAAYAVNRIGVSRKGTLYFGTTNLQGLALGAVFGFMSLVAGLFIDYVMIAHLGFALPLGLVGSSAVGSIAYWFVTTLLAPPGSSAVLKWSMAGLALVFGAISGLGATLLALLA